METQADALLLPRASSPLLAVTGGKGGVGKSTVAANLAVALATASGRGVAPRVLLADLDLGLASLDALLSLPKAPHLGDALEGRADFAGLRVRGPGGIEVLQAPRGIARFAALAPAERASLVASLRAASRGSDVTILDLPAGIHPDGLAFVHAADVAILVTTPDPAALADAYAVAKLASRESPALPLGLVVNGAPGPAEARRVAERLAAVARRFLGVPLISLGWIPRDAAVSRATAARRPVVLSEPSSPAASAFRLLAARLSSRIASHASSGVL